MAVRGDRWRRGSVVGGYRIDELISRGGMGVVYRATNVALNRIYALKVLAPELAEDEQFRRALQARDADRGLAAPSEHRRDPLRRRAGGPAVLRDGLRHRHRPARGPAQAGALDPNRAVDLLEQFASALDAAHRARARPPRRQAGEHPDHGQGRRGARLPHRLRAREEVRHRLWADRQGLGGRDRRLHGAGADHRQPHRRADGHLRARLRLLPDAHRQGALRARELGRDAVRARARAAAAARGDDQRARTRRSRP